jgi:hypothetical protein
VTAGRPTARDKEARKGAWLGAYLVRRSDGYCLIAHEPLPPSVRP